ncbi:hypothetical protein WDU94_013709 [Cyamophila willieti]
MRAVFIFMLAVVVLAALVEAVGPAIGSESSSSTADCQRCHTNHGVCDKNTCDLGGGTVWQWVQNPNGKYQWHLKD